MSLWIKRSNTIHYIHFLGSFKIVKSGRTSKGLFTYFSHYKYTSIFTHPLYFHYVGPGTFTQSRDVKIKTVYENKSISGFLAIKLFLINRSICQTIQWISLALQTSLFGLALWAESDHWLERCHSVLLSKLNSCNDICSNINLTKQPDWKLLCVSLWQVTCWLPVISFSAVFKRFLHNVFGQ